MFALSAVLATAILAALTVMESGPAAQPIRPAGDTTLGRNSIHWIGGLALAAAVFICFFLI